MAPAAAAPTLESLAGQLVAAWEQNAALTVHLLENIPDDGLQAVPAGSRGRTVAEQLRHLDRVRRTWLGLHCTGQRPTFPKAVKGEPIPREELLRELRESGGDVATHLAACLRGEARVRMFGGDPVRWMAYLITHDAHHRGQILLALKQNGMRMDESVSMEGLWGRWYASAKARPA